MSHFDEKYTLDVFRQLLMVDSTTGQYQAIQEKTAEIIRSLGFEPSFTHKGGILADLGGTGSTACETPLTSHWRIRADPGTPRGDEHRLRRIP